MMIRCPNCGRMGSLPDHLASDAQSLRCRRCSAHFLTKALPGPGAGSRRGSPLKGSVTSRKPGAASAFLAGGFFAGYDEPGPPSRDLGPGDSHYELTFTLHDVPGDSGVEWPAVSPEDVLSAAEEPSGEFVAPPVQAASPLDLWSYRSIDSWSRLLFWAALGFAVLCLPVLGFLLVRILGGSPDFNATTVAFVVGSVVAISFLFISLAVTALNVLLVDLARSIRRLRDQADRKARIIQD